MLNLYDGPGSRSQNLDTYICRRSVVVSLSILILKCSTETHQTLLGLGKDSLICLTLKFVEYNDKLHLEFTLGR